MKKRSKKKLLFDVLTGVDAATRGGVQGYMAGKKFSDDRESQKLKDLLRQAQIDSLLGKEQKKQQQNALEEEQLNNAIETATAHNPSFLEKSPSIIQDNVKKLTGITGKDPEYEQAINRIVTHSLKSKGIKDNKENRSSERSIIENEIKLNKEVQPKEEEEQGLLSSAKSLLTRNPFDPQTYKNMASVAVKTPGRIGTMAMNALGAFDEKMAASKEKQGLKRISPSLSEGFAPVVESIKKGDKKIDDFIGGDPKAKENEALELSADLLTPLPGAKISRAGKSLPRMLKNVGKGAATGGLYGALYGEGDPEAIKTGALLGGGLHGIIGSKTPKATQGKYKKLEKSSTVKDPEDISKMQKVFGEQAELQDLVGSRTFINKATKQRGQSNTNRMETMLENSKKYAEKIEEQLPNTPREKIYDDLSSFKKGMTKEKDRLFNAAKNVNDGVLNPPEIKTFWNSIKKALVEVKSLPKMKKTQGNINAKYIQQMDPIVQSTSNVIPEMYPRGYKSWYGENSKVLPIVEDVMEYRSSIQKLAERADDSSLNTYVNLIKDIDNVLESIGSSAKTQEARSWFAKNYSSLKSAEKGGKGTNFSQAIDKNNFGDTPPGIWEIFGKTNSNEAEQIFRQLTPNQKLDVVGNMFHSLKAKTIERKVADFFEKLPDYIKNTKDKKIRSILEETEGLALPSAQENITRYQGATSENIGTRKQNRTTRQLLGILLGGSNPLVGAAYGGYKAGKAGINSAKWNKFNQKNLESYLAPETTKIIKQNKNPNLRIALRTQKQKEEEK